MNYYDECVTRAQRMIVHPTDNWEYRITGRGDITSIEYWEPVNGELKIMQTMDIGTGLLPMIIEALQAIVEQVEAEQ